MPFPDRFESRWYDPCRACWTLALSVFVALLCGQQSVSQTVTKSHASYSIRGVVLNSVTREPIGRALVYSADERLAAFTDDRGRFELEVQQPPAQSSTSALPPGSIGSAPAQSNPEYPLSARKPGFLEDLDRGVRVQLRADPKDVTLYLIPEGMIVGRVKFPNPEAADAVAVQLYRREIQDGQGHWVPAQKVTTRSDGEFRFAELAAGDYKVFSLESMEQDPLTSGPNGPVYGFPPRYFSGARDFATASTIQIRAGETFTAGVAPERQRYYEVSVPVAGDQPGRVPGLEVSVFSKGHRGPGFELGYDPSAQAIRGTLPNGSYTIEAASFQPVAATGVVNVNVADGPVNGTPMVMTPNISIEINFRMDVAANGNAQTRDATRDGGVPPPFVRLQSADEFAKDRSSSATYQAQGDPSSIVGVQPGRYWVQVFSSPYYPAAVTSGGRDLLREPLTVPYGASVPPLEITLRDGAGEIEATVEEPPTESTPGQPASRDNAGGAAGSFPARQWIVFCLPLASAGTPARQFSPWPDGHFSLDLVPPGDYRILAFDRPRQLEYRNPARMNAHDSKGQVIHLAAGQKLILRLQAIEGE